MKSERKKLKSLYRGLWRCSHCDVCGLRFEECSRSVMCIVSGGLTPVQQKRVVDHGCKS